MIILQSYFLTLGVFGNDSTYVKHQVSQVTNTKLSPIDYPCIPKYKLVNRF